MSDLIDMQYSAKERKANYGPVSDSKGPAYSYGLCLRLEKPELEKLGISDLPKVGEEFHLMAVARVTSVNQELREDDQDSRSVSLQIQFMEIMDEEDEPDSEENMNEEQSETKSILSRYK